MSDYEFRIVGGGQLGQMIAEAAIPMGYHVTVLEKSLDCPAALSDADVILGEITDPEKIAELADGSDVVTIEIEHTNAEALQDEADDGKNVQPSPYSLAIIKDKLLQKKTLQKAGIPIGPFTEVKGNRGLRKAERLYQNAVLKSRSSGYDGRGNLTVTGGDWPDWQTAVAALETRAIYAEQTIDIQKELSVITARDMAGRLAVYPLIEMVNSNNICNEAFPVTVDPAIEHDAFEIAQETMRQWHGAGVFAIEMFLTEDDQVLVNETAPRVHNSGHWTIEGAETSQFEQHVRAVSGLPLGPTGLTHPATVMINIIGEKEEGTPAPHADLAEVWALPNTEVHYYGKSARPDRKLGHITVWGEDLGQVRQDAQAARRMVRI